MNAFAETLRELFGNGGYAVPIAVIFASGAALLIWTTIQSHRIGSAITHSSYQLVHSELETKNYFSADIYLGDPSNVRSTAHWLKEQLGAFQRTRSRVDRIAFIEKTEGPVGAVTLKDLVSYLTSIPTLTVRSRSEIAHPAFSLAGSRAKGATGLSPVAHGEKMIVISDVATTGTTIMGAVTSLRTAGAEVLAVFVLYDREEGAKKALQDNGLALVSQMRFSEVEGRSQSTQTADAVPTA